MKKPICNIKLCEGNQNVKVDGTLADVGAALDSSGLVTLNDPYGRPVTINAANVATITEHEFIVTDGE